MTPPPIDKKILAALGRSALSACDTTKASPCLDVETEVHTGPCLSIAPIDTADTGNPEIIDDTAIGPCLSPPLDTSDTGDDTGTSDTATPDTGGQADSTPALDLLADLRHTIRKQLVKQGILPPDVKP